jgi:hypothetical protein
LQEIGAVDALKAVASSPYEVAAKLASQALTIIGEDVPYKLSQQVPLWSTEDVRYWVTKVCVCMFVCMCLCACVCMFVYILYICVCVFVYIHINIYMCVCVRK